MNNVYIGMRYIPKLENSWDSTKTYEPLTQVPYGNNFYVSKRYVPAGTLPTNTDYWLPAGNYNAQIQHLQNEVDDINNNKLPAINSSISDLNTSVSNLQTKVDLMKTGKKTIIYIGDSFMYGPGVLTQQLDARLYKNASYNCSHGATGFVRDVDDLSFPHQLDAAASNPVIPNNEITDIIIVGGVNDDVNTYEAQYIDAINAMISRRDTSFPNAKMWFVPMAWGTTKLTSGDQEKYTKIYNACVKCGVATLPYAYTFLSGLDASTYMLPGDTIHPNTEGCALIAGFIADWVNGGRGSVDRLTIGNIVSTQNENIAQSVIERDGSIYLKWFFYSRDVTYAADTKICDVDDRVNLSQDLKYPVTQIVTAGTYDGQLYIKNNGLYSTTQFGYCDVTAYVDIPREYIY